MVCPRTSGSVGYGNLVPVPPVDRRPSRPWIGPVIGIVIVLTAVGGLVARNVYQPPTNSAVSAPAAPPPSTTTSGTPIKQPGSRNVQLSADAAAMPYGSAVQQVLQTYYNAINDKDYLEWESVVTQSFIQANPEQNWLSAYRFTQDGSMYVYRIDAGPQGSLRVLLSFTSLQDAAHEPIYAPYTCINWHSVLPLVLQSTGWKVDTGANGQHPPTTQCQN